MFSTLTDMISGDPSVRHLRRRGQSLITAIIEATWEVLDDAGHADPIIEEVATHPRASKAPIYPRWEGKPQLVYAAGR